MSNLLCGTLQLTRLLTPREAGDLGFNLTALALKERLGLQLGCAIVQPRVLDIVGCGRAFDGARVPYLLTDNPLWDASEAIVDKYAPEYPDEEPDGPLEARLARVQRFLVEVLSLPEVEAASLVITSGSGERPAPEAVRADQLVERLLPRYADVLEIPLVHFLVEKIDRTRA